MHALTRARNPNPERQVMSKTPNPKILKAKMAHAAAVNEFVTFACEKSLNQYTLVRDSRIYTVEHYPVWLAMQAIPLDSETNGGGGISQMLYDAITHAVATLIKANPDSDLFMWFKWYGHFNSEASGRNGEYYAEACMRADLLEKPAYTFTNDGAMGEPLNFKLYPRQGGYLCVVQGGEMVAQLFAFWLGDE